jgi:hypothetical protein
VLLLLLFWLPLLFGTSQVVVVAEGAMLFIETCKMIRQLGIRVEHLDTTNGQDRKKCRAGTDPLLEVFVPRLRSVGLKNFVLGDAEVLVVNPAVSTCSHEGRGV